MEKEDNKTSIAISDDLWLELNKRKRQGESFEQVVKRLVNLSISFNDISKCKTVGEVRELTKEVLGE